MIQDLHIKVKNEAHIPFEKVTSRKKTRSSFHFYPPLFQKKKSSNSELLFLQLPLSGVLRALEDLNLAKDFSQLSVVAGSAWATAAYVFSDASAVHLLGAGTMPQNLTLEAGWPWIFVGGGGFYSLKVRQIGSTFDQVFFGSSVLSFRSQRIVN